MYRLVGLVSLSSGIFLGVIQNQYTLMSVDHSPPLPGIIAHITPFVRTYHQTPLKIPLKLNPSHNSKS